MNIIWALIATFIVSLLSFIGALTLLIKDKWLKKILILLVGLSAGALLGGALLHLIPETLEEISSEKTLLFVLIGFAAFLLLEKLLHWHHDHKCEGKCEKHTLAYMILIGDGMHNFIDGLIIATSFMVDVKLGLVTTLAVIAHEIPQEISDFGVLVYGGFSKIKALLFNFFSALVAIFGAIIGLILSAQVEGFTPLFLAITAGGFIYIAASDLIPELNKEPKISKSLLSFIIFLIGILLMYILKLVFEG